LARQSQPTIANRRVVAKLVRIDLTTAGGRRPDFSSWQLFWKNTLKSPSSCSRIRAISSVQVGLSDTRRAIGEAFPAIARTVNECLPERRGFPPADIPEIVRLFAENLQQLGGEEHLMQPVALHVVKDFRGFNRERVTFQADHNSILRQQ